jgi:hypothetical protein
MNDAYLGCEAIMQGALTFVEEARTSISRDCASPYGSLDFATDPCCNMAFVLDHAID